MPKTSVIVFLAVAAAATESNLCNG